MFKNHFPIYWYFPHMNILSQPATKTEHDDIPLTKKLCNECVVFYIIPRVKWVEQRVLWAVQYVQLYLTKKFKGTLLPRKAPRKKTILIFVFFPSITTIKRSVLLMTTVQLIQVSGHWDGVNDVTINNYKCSACITIGMLIYSNFWCHCILLVIK